VPVWRIFAFIVCSRIFFHKLTKIFRDFLHTLSRYVLIRLVQHFFQLFKKLDSAYYADTVFHGGRNLEKNLLSPLHKLIRNRLGGGESIVNPTAFPPLHTQRHSAGSVTINAKTTVHCYRDSYMPYRYPNRHIVGSENGDEQSGKVQVHIQKVYSNPAFCTFLAYFKSSTNARFFSIKV
jgi:hypothetical protein